MFVCNFKLQLSKEFKLKQLVQDVKLTCAVTWLFGRIVRWFRMTLCGNTAHHRDVGIETLKGVKRSSGGMGWF